MKKLVIFIVIGMLLRSPAVIIAAGTAWFYDVNLQLLSADVESPRRPTMYYTDDDGRMYLFFQGNNNKGKSWFLSNMIVKWDGQMPYLIRQRDNQIFRIRETIKPSITIDAAKTR